MRENAESDKWSSTQFFEVGGQVQFFLSKQATARAAVENKSSGWTNTTCPPPFGSETNDIKTLPCSYVLSTLGC